MATKFSVNLVGESEKAVRAAIADRLGVDPAEVTGDTIKEQFAWWINEIVADHRTRAAAKAAREQLGNKPVEIG